MKKIDDFLQSVFCLVLSGNISESCLYVSIGIYLGSSVAERHEVAAVAHPASDASGGLSPYEIEYDAGENPHEQEVEQRGVFLRYNFIERNLARLVRTLGRQQPVYQFWVVDLTCLISYCLAVGFFRREVDVAALNHNVLHLSAVHLSDKSAVVGFDYAATSEFWKDKAVEKQHKQKAPQKSVVWICLFLVLSVCLLHKNCFFRLQR